MAALIQASKNRKASSLPERLNLRERSNLTERSSIQELERTGSKLSATLQWLAHSLIGHRDEQIELILVTWHPLILEDSFGKDELSAQQILDQTIRRCSPRSTMVCGGHRVWWLLSSGELTLKLKQFKARMERAISKQALSYPLFDKLEDTLIVQRIGCWNGPITATAKGLAGIFADMAAGQSLLENFGLPFDRHRTRPTAAKHRLEKAYKTVSSRPQSARVRSTRMSITQSTSSTWVTALTHPTLGQFQSNPGHLAHLEQLW